jgi:hypothetical protein
MLLWLLLVAGVAVVVLRVSSRLVGEVGGVSPGLIAA